MYLVIYDSEIGRTETQKEFFEHAKEIADSSIETGGNTAFVYETTAEKLKSFTKQYRGVKAVDKAERKRARNEMWNNFLQEQNLVYTKES